VSRSTSRMSKLVPLALALCSFSASALAEDGWQKLFTEEGPVKDGWTVRNWANIKDPPVRDVSWEVKDGILYGTGRFSEGEGDPLGTWLMSEREYGDFNLELEFRFKDGGLWGNGGVALRTPLEGDPAYQGIELQITDERYERKFFPDAGNDQLSGALYFVSPAKSLEYKQGEWNEYRIETRGSKIKVWLNGVQVQDVDLATLTKPAKMHGKGTEILPAAPGAARPLRGHIGFQDLSEYHEALTFRNVRIQALN
jgi:hypothetical protein